MTVDWKEATRSSVACGVTASHCSIDGRGVDRISSLRAAISALISCDSTHRSTAVLSPLKLKSSAFPFILAIGKRIRCGSPWTANWSSTGPPG